MNRGCISIIVALAILCGNAHADATFQFLFDGGYVLDVSDDGSVITGNTAGDFEPFRWTQSTGLVPLGMATGPVIGVGGGTPGISVDGAKIASTILTADSLYATQGLWTLGTGWQQLMPPTPPDGGLVDLSYGSVWGMSGNGEVVVGLYWRPGSRAHASKWTQATGVVDLGSTGQASRADGANFDGSVIVGWDEHPTGPRRPAAWVNGNLSILSSLDGMGEARAVTADGMVATGWQRDPASNMQAAALWRWNGTGWDAAQILGVVHGTFADIGRAIGFGISADAKLVVGYNTFAGDPFYTTGFLWTDATGCIDVDAFLAERGLTPAGFDIQSLSAVTPDGKSIFGYGRMATAPFTVKSFMIQLDSAVDAPVLADAKLEVLRAWPNPTRGTTSLALTLPRSTHGSLTIHDSSGRLVRRLLSGTMASGSHDVAWDGRDDSGAQVAAGIYYSRFDSQELRESCKLVVLR